ncbi:hypothetical protein, partial [Salinispira pacifica]
MVIVKTQRNSATGRKSISDGAGTRRLKRAGEPGRRRLLLAAVLLAATAAGAGAQDLLVFGDVEAAAQETLSSPDAQVAALGGFPASRQYLTGNLALHLSSRLSFDSGELYVDDT